MSLDTNLDPWALREDFPILARQVHEQPLIYLDNAATTQKPQPVIEALSHYYRDYNANIHRGLHQLAELATEAYEGARIKLQHYIHAASSKEMIFVRGTTEAINLVAQTWGRTHLRAGDEVLVSMMEHHANIVPWQLLRDQLGIQIKVIPVNALGELDLEAYQQMFTPQTRLVAVTHVSNALGTINPIREMTAIAHDFNVPILVDGAQAVPHLQVDVQALDCDFYAFSGHKMYGPTGIGILYAKQALLEQMPPWQGGGEMIKHVSFAQTTYADLPHRFEAGTPAIAQAIGLGVAADYLTHVGLENIQAWEHELLTYATEQMSTIEGLRILGQAPNKAGVISFVMQDVHAQDLGLLLDQLGIAIRTGHHCAMPVLHHFGVNATARASFALYNTFEEIDALVAGIHKVRQMMS